MASRPAGRVTNADALCDLLHSFFVPYCAGENGNMRDIYPFIPTYLLTIFTILFTSNP